MHSLALPALVWLTNAFFVITAIFIIFMTLRLIAHPPRSHAEAILEAHKVVIVAAFSLASVAIIEVIEVAPKLPEDGIGTAILGALVLLGVIFCGLGLFTVALVQDEEIRKKQAIDWVQVGFGLFLFLVTTVVAVEFKNIDAQVSARIANKFNGHHS